MSRKNCSTLTVIAAFIGFGFLPLASFAQLNASNLLTPEQLVQDVLAGPGITITNVVYNGVPSPATPQAGSAEFASGTTNLGISDGIILACGDPLEIEGPQSFFASTILGGGSDPDLVVLSGQVISDAAILEFDFVPVGDSLNFSYVFGSDEYPNFACSNFNDAFGFFLSGPGINGPFTNNAENIAILPGTTLPVSIANVNGGNPPDTTCTGVNIQYYFDNAGGTTIAHNGFTVVLQAKAQVQCGQTYHIKLAIGDAFDSSYDSGVFLEAGSFQSNAIQVEVGGSISGDSSIVEGCSQALITFVRPDTLSGVDTVIFLIGGNATNGIDYDFISDTVIFALGEDSVAIDIIPINDGVVDGPDTLIITAYTITVCGDTLIDTGILYIVDSIAFAVDAPDISVVCPSDSVTLVASALGDPMDHDYAWSTGQVDSVITVPFSGLPADTFYVAVTDTCGTSTTIDTVVVINNIGPAPSADAGTDITVACANVIINLNASVTNGIGPFTYVWSTGATGQSATYNLPSTQWISVTITDGCGVQTIDSLLATIAPILPLVDAGADLATNCANVPINLSATGSSGTPPYTYSWSIGLNGQNVSYNLPNTQMIYVTITDACGSQAIDSLLATLTIILPLVDAGADLTTNCASVPINLSATGSSGTAPYTYSWSIGLNGQNVSYNLLNTQMIYVTITDACGSQAIDSLLATLTPILPSVDAGADFTVTCANSQVNLSATGSGGTAPYTYSWSIGLNGQSVAYNLPGTQSIYVTVTDACGAQASDTLLATVTPIPPDIVVTANTAVLCPGDAILLDVFGQNGTAPYAYTWSTGENADQIQVFPLVSTWYYVEMTDACNPSPVLDSIFVSVPIIAPITDGFQNLSTICPSDVVTLDPEAAGGSGQGFTYEWDDSSTGSTNQVTVNSTTTYSVIVTDACGTAETFDVTVTVATYDPILVVATAESLICEGTSTPIISGTSGGGSGNTFSWSGSGASPTDGPTTTVTPTSSPSVYTLTVTDQCGNTGIGDVTVMTEACSVLPPNVISPNGDGFNDAFVILNIERWPGNNVKIMNRWGKTILDQDDYENDWKASGYSEGTYYYIITISEDKAPLTGTLTVVRK
jgi:gliding motility-associated-like protein